MSWVFTTPKLSNKHSRNQFAICFRENLKCESPPLPRFSFDPVGGERGKEREDLESYRERLGVIEERWKQLSSNNLCYVARMEEMEHGDQNGGRIRRTRSSLSLSPLSRWV